MRKALVATALFCLLVAAIAPAQEETRTEATVTVESIDHAAKSMAWVHTIMDTAFPGSGKWNAKTRWVDASQGWDKEKPATEALASSIKVGARIYVEERNRVLEVVKLVPPES